MRGKGEEKGRLSLELDEPVNVKVVVLEFAVFVVHEKDRKIFTVRAFARGSAICPRP